MAVTQTTNRSLNLHGDANVDKFSIDDWNELVLLVDRLSSQAVLRLRWSAPDAAWVGPNGDVLTTGDIAALRPAAIDWLCPIGAEPVWGTTDTDANEAYNDEVHQIGV